MKFTRHYSPGPKRIREYWFTIFGYDCHLRFVPLEFKVEVKRIERLIDERWQVKAREAIDQAYKRWGYDPDLIRADTLNDFMNED